MPIFWAISWPVEICHGGEYAEPEHWPQCYMDIPVVFSGGFSASKSPFDSDKTAKTGLGVIRLVAYWGFLGRDGRQDYWDLDNSLQDPMRQFS